MHEFYHKLTTVKTKATHKLTTLKIIHYKACENMSNIHLTLYLMSMENSILDKSFNTWSMWLYLHTCLKLLRHVIWHISYWKCLSNVQHIEHHNPKGFLFLISQIEKNSKWKYFPLLFLLCHTSKNTFLFETHY